MDQLTLMTHNARHEQEPTIQKELEFYRYAWDGAVELCRQIAERVGFDTTQEPPEGLLTTLHVVEDYADRMEAENKALKAALHTVEGNYQWKPIESAPKDGTTVILYAFNAALEWDVVGYGRWDGVGPIAGWISRGFTEPPGNLGLAHPTHWMPLPKPPALVTAERERV